MQLTEDWRGVFVEGLLTEDGAPGQAERSGLVLAGDNVAAVAGVTTDGWKYDEVIEAIVAAERPLEIEFGSRSEMARRNGSQPPRMYMYCTRTRSAQGK